MKVLHYIDGLHPGGKERRLVECLKAFAAGHEVAAELAVMSLENRYPEVLKLGTPIWPLIRRTPHDLRIFRDFYRLCRARRPDVIHTWDPMTAFFAAPVALALGIPLVNGMITKAPARLPWHSGERLVGMVTFPLSAAVVGNSQAGLRAYRAPRRKSRCVHNGFDFNRLAGLEDPAVVRQHGGIKTRWAVAMVGEFTAKKDYPTFLRAAQMLLTRRGDVTFLAVGDGPRLAEMQASVPTAARERILFPGWVERVESLMQAVDVGVLATDADVHGEGIPNAALEFMALGKPVVATRTGGTEELVVDAVSGYLMGNRDPAALAAHLERLLDDPLLAQRMGRCGRDRVGAEFSIAAMTGAFCRLYREVLHGRNPHPASRRSDAGGSA